MAIFAHQVPETHALLTAGNARVAVQLASLLDKPGMLQLTAEVTPEVAGNPVVRGIGVTPGTFWFQVEVLEEGQGPVIISTEALPLQVAFNAAA